MSLMRISRQPTPLQIKIDKNRWRMWKPSTTWCSMITNDARCTREIEARIAMAKAAFNRKSPTD
jgi:hypothetical protein